MAEGATWSRGPGSARELRALLHLAVGVPVAAAVLALVAVGGAAVGGGVSGVVLGGGVVLLALGSVGAWRRGLLGRVGALATRAADASSESGALLDALRPPWLVGVVAVATAGLALVATVDPGLALALALAGHLLPALAVGLLSTAGELEPDEGLLRYGDDEIPLRTLAAVRCRRVGGYAFLWCSFVRGTGRTPGLVVVPAAVHEEHRTAIEAGLAASVPGAETPDRPLRLVAYGFGGSMLALGLLSGGALYASGVSLVLGAYVGGSLALLGAFFVVLGRYET